ncbi:hypothetical protein DHEL01_v205253 [Diaporthe helianthi]|uniref:Uncharacterized protein n=1 Tax=Diaporthe helianthi TaxID=158607 RepID=A0A2P5I1L8_DIAHE|nr:hypothetical protein DHEL01_v205253 [Diaporthe helianthi]
MSSSGGHEDPDEDDYDYGHPGHVSESAVPKYAQRALESTRPSPGSTAGPSNQSKRSRREDSSGSSSGREHQGRRKHSNRLEVPAVTQATVVPQPIPQPIEPPQAGPQNFGSRAVVPPKGWSSGGAALPPQNQDRPYAVDPHPYLSGHHVTLHSFGIPRSQPLVMQMPVAPTASGIQRPQHTSIPISGASHSGRDRRQDAQTQTYDAEFPAQIRGAGRQAPAASVPEQLRVRWIGDTTTFEVMDPVALSYHWNPVEEFQLSVYMATFFNYLDVKSVGQSLPRGRSWRACYVKWQTMNRWWSRDEDNMIWGYWSDLGNMTPTQREQRKAQIIQDLARGAGRRSEDECLGRIKLALRYGNHKNRANLGNSFKQKFRGEGY